MYHGYTLQELLLIVVCAPLFIATLIAFIDVTFINNVILSVHNWIKRPPRYYFDDSSFKKLFRFLLTYSGQMANGVTHRGWRSGLASYSLTSFILILFIAVVLLRDWIIQLLEK